VGAECGTGRNLRDQSLRRGTLVLARRDRLRGRRRRDPLLLRDATQLPARGDLCLGHTRWLAALRAGMRRALAAAVMTAAILGGCYRSHERPRDASDPSDGVSTSDAWPNDDASHDGSFDVNPASLEAGGICDSRDMTWGTPCTPEIQIECERRAQEWARGRYGHSRCVDVSMRFSTCTIGEYCEEDRCTCTPTRACGPRDVCVSDTPDGPTRCVRRCSGL
jgi:hypothetical protein